MSRSTPPADAATKPSSLRVTLTDPLYRGATIALFISGLGASAAAPQIARFLVQDLGASLTVAGLYYLTNLTAPLAGFLIGARSDHTGNRLGLFRGCAVIGFVGWVLIAFSTHVWMPFVISALVLGFAGAAGSQLFAAIHDNLQAHDTNVADGVTSIVRMALTAGWVVGPVLGAFLAAAFGFRTLLLFTGFASFAQILPLGFLRDTSPVDLPFPDDAAGEQVVARQGFRVMLPLLAFTGLYVLVYAGEPIKYAYLPIYMDQNLGLSAFLSGAIIGIQPLVELALMPVAVLVARRIGLMTLMVIGAGLGILANLCFAFTGSAVGLFTGQILMGGVWAVFAALGIIVAQRLLPTAVATASAIFMSSVAIASALGGLTGGLGVAALGLPLVFLGPALYGVLATIGLFMMTRSRHNIR
ncbi:MAG: MFS transporter [Actinomycetales bacterium]